METTFGCLMMPQDSGPIEIINYFERPHFRWSPCLWSHLAQDLDIYHPGKEIHDWDEAKNDCSPVKEHLHLRKCKTIYRLHQANYRIRRLCIVLKYDNNGFKAKLTFNQVSYLQKCDWLRICQGHSVFKVKCTLSVEVETFIFFLNNT